VLGEAVGDNQDEAIARLGGRDGPKDVNGQLRERLSSREQRQGRRVSPQGDTVLGTSCALGVLDCDARRRLHWRFADG